MSKSAHLSNFTCIPRQPVQTNRTQSFKHKKIALLNVRSLSGKTFLINDCIVRQKLDFLFFTETWLDQDNSAAALIE